MSEKCVAPKCKRAPALWYLGKHMCDYHWDLLCWKLDKEVEKRLKQDIIEAHILEEGQDPIERHIQRNKD